MSREGDPATKAEFHAVLSLNVPEYRRRMEDLEPKTGRYNTAVRKVNVLERLATRCAQDNSTGCSRWILRMQIKNVEDAIRKAPVRPGRRLHVEQPLPSLAPVAPQPLYPPLPTAPPAPAVRPKPLYPPLPTDPSPPLTTRLAGAARTVTDPIGRAVSGAGSWVGSLFPGAPAAPAAPPVALTVSDLGVAPLGGARSRPSTYRFPADRKRRTPRRRRRRTTSSRRRRRRRRPASREYRFPGATRKRRTSSRRRRRRRTSSRRRRR